MQPVFERFLERLWDSVDEVDFRNALGEVASQFDLLAFAYLLLPPRSCPIRCDLFSHVCSTKTVRCPERRWSAFDGARIGVRAMGSTWQVGLGDGLHSRHHTSAPPRFISITPAGSSV